jgi:3-methyladenine DNA glycosylase AlkD
MVLQTMDVDAEVSWFRARLEQNAEPANEAGMRRVIPSALPAHVVRVPELRRIASEWRSANKDVAAEDLITLADALWATGWREEMLLALMVLSRSRPALHLLDWPAVERWSAQIDNWEHVDQCASAVTGPLLLARPQLIDAVRRLAVSDSPWQRRLAIVTLIQATRHDAAWLPELDAMATKLTGDKGPSLRKAVAWARKVQRETEARIAR